MAETEVAEVVDGEIVEHRAPPGTDIVASSPTGAELAELPNIPGRDEFVALCLEAQLLAKSELVPKALRGKAPDVLLVLLTARDLDIPITAALRTVYPIDGQVSLAPKLLIARIHKLGLGRIVPGECTAESATGTAYGPNGEVYGSFTFTWEDARMAELVGKECTPTAHKRNSSGRCPCKDNWRKYPQRMLWWRCVGYLVDDHYSEASYGIYAPDELGAITDESGRPIDTTSVPVPAELAGFSDRNSAPASDDEPLSFEDKQELWIRIAALDEDGRSQVKANWERAALPRLADVSQRKLGTARAVLAAVEANRRNAGYDLEAGTERARAAAAARLAAEKAVRENAAKDAAKDPTPPPSENEEPEPKIPQNPETAGGPDITPAAAEPEVEEPEPEEPTPISAMTDEAPAIADQAIETNFGVPIVRLASGEYPTKDAAAAGELEGKIIAAMQVANASVTDFASAVAAHEALIGPPGHIVAEEHLDLIDLVGQFRQDLADLEAF